MCMSEIIDALASGAGFAVGGPVGAGLAGAAANAVQGGNVKSDLLAGVGGALSGGTIDNIGTGVLNSGDIALGGAGDLGAGQTIGSLVSGAGDAISGGLTNAENTVSGWGSSLSNLLSGSSAAPDATAGLNGGDLMTGAGQDYSSLTGQGAGSAPGAGYIAPSGGSSAMGAGAGGGTSSVGPGALATGASPVNDGLSAGDNSIINNITNPGSSLVPTGSANTGGVGIGGTSYNIPGGVLGPSAAPGIIGNAAAATAAPAAASSGMNASTLAQLLGAGYNAYTTNANSKALIASQNQSLANEAPFLAGGTAAEATLGNDLGTSGNTTAAGYGSLTAPFNPNNLASNPGYQFQEQQGNQALENQEAAAGNLNSGAALKAASEFNQGLANTDYNNAFNENLAQNQATYSDLAGQANLGAGAASTDANTNTNVGMANTLANNQLGANLTQTLSSLLSGSGAKKQIGVNAAGQPIYG